MSTGSMPKSSSSYANLHVPENLYLDLSEKVKEVTSALLQYKNKENKQLEFEIRLGKYETSRDRLSFVPGISYEEFSRFYTFLEENYTKESSENYLDIYSDSVTTSRDKKPIRMTITGSGAIMNYCTTNMLPPNVTFQVKERISEHLNIDICDLRLSVSEEKELKIYEMALGTMEKLNKELYDSSKQFRYKKRMSYLSLDKMFRYDLTQTKQVYSGSNLKSERSLGESELFNQQPVYEVEVELVNKEAGLTVDLLVQHITNIMQIRGNTELVLTNNQKEYILKDFLGLYLDKKNVDKEFDEFYNRRDKQYHKMFPGAKVSTLELDNLFSDASSKKPYIFKDYTVTDKADGERYLLFIDSQNFIFFINDRMEILRTDIQLTDSDRLGSTVLDGELVVTIEKGVQVYHYYAFDVIFNSNSSAFKRNLFPDSNENREGSRIGILETIISKLKQVQSPTINGIPFVEINMKNLRSIDGENQLQMTKYCSDIWSNRQEGFKYHLDGLIFTPKFEAYPIGKLWASALKWKPPEENSIDFLIKFRSGDKAIQTSLEGDVVMKYQLADLYVGDIVERRGFKEYVEKKFDLPNTISTEPTYLIRVPVNSTGSRDDVMVRDETIIECVWNNGWKVLRTRLDKTQRYLSSGKKISGTANNIGVAISIWSTIVHPITTDMITGVTPIVANKKSEYYSNVGTSLTEPVRGFNNYMKALLIGGARKSGSALIDFSCGRAGDLQKWFSSNYDRVVGLDYSRTGIESLDPAIGAYGRIESKKRTNPKFAKWADGVELFWADTSKMVTPMYQNGICSSNKKLAAKKALEVPFDVGVSFFTAHYYFESPMKIRGFFQNLFDNIKNGGLAIITCFDGQEIFKWLEHLEPNQIYSGLVDSKPVWQIKKGYNKHTPFLDNSYNVGLKIDIKFESISDDYLTEYLVHPNYLLKIAEEYGFTLISKTEAESQFGLNSGSGLFGDIMERLDDSSELNRLRTSDIGRIYYDDIKSLVSDDKYTDLREWNKHNRYYIFRKNSVDNAVAKTWRSKLSKYDCDKEYEQEVNVEIDLPESAVEEQPVATVKVIDHTEAPIEEVSEKPKKKLIRKQPVAVPEPVVVVPEPVDDEDVPLQKKRLIKKKVVTESTETVESVEPTQKSNSNSKSKKKANVQESVQETIQTVPTDEIVLPKKKLIKKKLVEEVSSEPIQETVEVVPEPTKPKNSSKNAPAAPRKKKTLAVSQNVLAMLQQKIAEPTVVEQKPVEDVKEQPVEVETKSEVQQALANVPVGTKIKISKKLLKK